MTSERTGYRNLEEALRFSEERYGALFQETPTMIVTVDADGVALSVNPLCATRLGYTIGELERQSVLKLFHPDDKKTDMLSWQSDTPRGAGTI